MLSKRNVHSMLLFVMKILGWIVVLDLTALSILWVLEILHLFTFILVYEALFILSLGIYQILVSNLYYKENSISEYRLVRRSSKLLKLIAKLKPEERQRYRQEGTVMIIIGLILLVATIVVHFSISY